VAVLKVSRSQRVELRPVRAIAVVLSAGCLLSGCGAPGMLLPLGPQPIAYADTLPIREPKVRDPLEAPPLMGRAVGDELSRVISIDRWTRGVLDALNITHFDDVVNSAWFEHRNEVHPLTLEEIARGPTTFAPDTGRTLLIIAGKARGISPGFTIEDARGNRYLFKFDPKGFLYLGSSADIVSSRLFWAAGYYTPEDFIVQFDPARLAVKPGTKFTNEFGQERPMTMEDVRATLARTDRLSNGRYLAVASRFVPGIPKGPFFFTGRRKDDPNDYYRHEYRRELRGLYVMSSWLNHTDMRFGNTLDAYVPPGYLRHYLIDFAGSLGSGTINPHTPREGVEYNFDFWETMGRVFSLGRHKVGWEDQAFEPIHPSIGWIPVEEFDPARWKPNWPNAAFTRVKVRDGYWGAKLVASFSDEQIRAAVGAAKLPDRFASDQLTRILIGRRDRVVQYWYSLVTPIEHLKVANDADSTGGSAGAFGLEFDDLGFADRVRGAHATPYHWEFKHPALGRHWAGDGGIIPNRARQHIHVGPGSGMIGTGGRHTRTRAHRLTDDQRIAILEITAIQRRGTPRAATVFLRWKGDDAGYQLIGLTH